MKQFLTSFLEILDYQHFDSMTKIIGFQINLSFIGVGFSFQILLEGNKTEVKEESVTYFRQIPRKNETPGSVGKLMQKTSNGN